MPAWAKPMEVVPMSIPTVQELMEQLTARETEVRDLFCTPEKKPRGGKAPPVPGRPASRGAVRSASAAPCRRPPARFACDFCERVFTGEVSLLYHKMYNHS